MTKSFTIYWTPEGWAGIGEGNPIPGAFGSGFKEKIPPGSRIFVTNIQGGALRLVGAFTAGSIETLNPSAETWNASEQLIAENGTSSPVKLTVVPTQVTQSLRFIKSDGTESAVAFDADGKVNGQAMRTIRQLTEKSADDLEALIKKPTDREWSEGELRASVNAYLEMLQKINANESFVKKDYYKSLANQFGRTPGAFEYRMQNISFVMGLMGRDWIPGLPPAKNVGVNIAAQLERYINEAENQSVNSFASEALIVSKERKSMVASPNGNQQPSQITSTSTSFVRDVKVKAWVLERAKGICEACEVPAPFTTVDGYPYLEVHHVRKLADKGSDTPSNAVALCPNCHRRLHFSVDALAYRDELYRRVSELKKE
jgi:5-methylcytosine-specific restriction endonuclease McrA